MSIGVGVIGTGVMGAEHARLIRSETPGAHLAGVFDADPARAQAAAAGGVVFSDPRSLIESDDIEAVIVASPDATHAELTVSLPQGRQAGSLREALGALRDGGPAHRAGGSRAEPQAHPGRLHAALRSRLPRDETYKEEGGVGATVILHNVHRNANAPGWFTGAMAVTNAFVHEIDISRWLTGSEMISGVSPRGLAAIRS